MPPFEFGLWRIVVALSALRFVKMQPTAARDAHHFLHIIMDLPCHWYVLLSLSFSLSASPGQIVCPSLKDNV